MFRTRKSDDSFIYRRPAGKPSEQKPLPEDSESSVASSALRWLTGSDQPVRAVESDAQAQERNDDVDDEASDILDLTDPLDAAKGDRSEPAETPSDEKSAPRPASDPTSDGVSDVMNGTAGDLPPLEFDDLDDLDDFDQISLLHLIEKSASSKDDRIRPADGVATPPADRGGSTPPPDDPMTRDGRRSVEKEASASSIDGKAMEATESRTVSAPNRHKPEPVPPQPLSKTPQSDDRPQDRPQPASLEEAPATLLDTSLALRPIPELQTSARALSKAAVKQSLPPDADPEKDAGAQAPAPASVSTVAPVSPAALTPPNADDDIDAATQDHGDPADNGLDIEALELDMDSSDDSDDSVGDDWHAHLADVLGNNDDASLSTPEDPAPANVPVKTARPPHKPVFRDQDEQSSPVIPLSRTLTELANTDKQAEEKADIPPFSLLTRTAPQKTAPNQPPSALPAEATELSLVQLSFGIVANVPRLRRFAAAQIGDELLADRLVQTTAETALADPGSLRPASDLGLALIKLLYRHRESMLADPSAIDRSPEDVQTFETALCRGLAGADQFEMHQFATAINGLDERDREFLIMVNLENLTYDQIADIVQMPKERVMAMVSNARMRLRQALASDESMDKGKSSTAIFTPHPQEIDIHGYLDGELDSGHMAEIDALVEHDEDAADRLVHYGIQGDLIRRLYTPLFNRPLPGALLESLSTAAKPARRGFRFGARRALIAGAIIVVLGFGAIGSGIAVALSGLFPDTITMSSVKLGP